MTAFRAPRHPSPPPTAFDPVAVPVALVVAMMVAAGCAQFRPPSGGAGDVEADPADCASAALIEDGEDGDDRIVTRNGRGGYLYTYMDEHGTRIAPVGDFAMAAGGAGDSKYAMRMTGTLAEAVDAYAGMGFSFMEPKGSYDASRYTGIAFAARRAADSAPAVRVKLPDAGTDPDGGACSDCYNDFGIDVVLTEAWTRYEVSFADLTQQVGWGEPRPEAIDDGRLYGVQIQVTQTSNAAPRWLTWICTPYRSR